MPARPHLASLAVSLTTALMAAPAQAWWDLGHSAICTEALHYIDTETRRELDTLLAHRGFRAFGSACNWADQIKPERPETAPWHYINASPGVTDIDNVERPEGGDILTALYAQLAVLRDRNADIDARSEALLWVGHLVGDLHQPLHVGWAGDRGGNDYALVLPASLQQRFGERRQTTNMHAVWDGYLLLYARNSRSLVSRLSDVRVDAGGRPEDWANESLSVLNQPATRYSEQRLDTLTEEYLEQQVPTALMRLKQAALRLATILNGALGD